MNEHDEETDLTFGEWLQDQIFSRGLTQERFADEIGVGQSTVSAWINGRQPGRRNCYRIAAYFGFPRQTVLERAGLEVRSSEIDPELGTADISGLGIAPEALEIWAEGSPWLGPEDWEAVRVLVRHIIRVKRIGR